MTAIKDNTVTFPDQLLRLDQVAVILSVSKRQIWRMIANGDLPEPVKIGRASRMISSDVQAYIEKLKSLRKH